MSFGEKIIDWYQVNKRELPWRGTRNPYFIWLSEIILQQTRVEQGMSYYLKFVKKYPDVKKLAAAKEDEVLKLWQGLGYYTRARNLHHTAKEIVKRFDGNFPQTWEEMRSLKGIGDYTAAAILSFAFDKKFPVVDGNVFRLLSRYLGINTPVNSSKAKKEFYEAAMLLMNGHAPDIFNQAMMEFGAMQCKPANPDCGNCPLSNSCFAFAKKKVKDLPVKNRNMKISKRYFYYLIIRHRKKVFLRKRTDSDIWKNLYDFPLIESSKKISSQKLFQSDEWKKVFGKTKMQLLSESKPFKHQLSHQTLFAKFYEIKISGKFSLKEKNVSVVSETSVHRYALPKLIENYLAEKK